MFKKIIENYKSFDKITHRIMNNGLKFCLILCLISVLILITYDISFPSPFTYYIGISLFKISLIFGIEFIVCGFVVDGIKNQTI